MLASQIGARAGLAVWQALRPAAGSAAAAGCRSFGSHPKHDPRHVRSDKPVPRSEDVMARAACGTPCSGVPMCAVFLSLPPPAPSPGADITLPCTA